MSRHLSDDDLINLLYEVEEPESHMAECHGCRARWERLLAKRESLLTDPIVSEELLAQQRRAIYQRLEEGSGWGWAFRPAGVALCVLLLAVLLSRPDPAPPPTTVATNDSQLFGEIYSMVESSEPSPVRPIYGLFEERQ